MQQFTIQDPRDIDGTAYEVAGTALRQAQGVAILLEKALKDSELMVFNAALSRADDQNEDLPDIEAWREGPLGKRLMKSIEQANALAKYLGYLAIAAEFDPKKR